MKFIKLTENVLVNPEKISVIQFKEMDGQRLLLVTVDNIQYVATVPTMSLLQDLLNSGLIGDLQIWSG